MIPRALTREGPDAISTRAEAKNCPRGTEMLAAPLLAIGISPILVPLLLKCFNTNNRAMNQSGGEMLDIPSKDTTEEECMG